MRNTINYTNDTSTLPPGTNLATDATMAEIIAEETLNKREQSAFALVDWLNSTLTSKSDSKEGRLELLDALEAVSFAIHSAYHDFYKIAESKLSKLPTENLSPSEIELKIKARANTIANEEVLSLVNLFAQEIVKHAKSRSIVEVSLKDILSFLLNYLHTSLKIREEDSDLAHAAVDGVMDLIDKKLHINKVLREADIVDKDISDQDESELPFSNEQINACIEYLKERFDDRHTQNQKLRKYGSLTFVYGRGLLSKDEIEEMKNAQNSSGANPNMSQKDEL